MIKLGLQSAILPELSLEELVSFASRQGISFVELMCWPTGKAERKYAGVTHLDVVDLDESRAARIKETLEASNVHISALGYYPNPLDPDRERADFYRSHIKKVIDAARLLGVGVVSTFVGRDPKSGLEESLASFAEAWPPLVQYASDRGVRVAIENCPMYFTSDEWPSGKNLAYSPAIWRRMFEIIPSASFGLNYDPSHFVWQQIDYLKPLYEFKDRIFHVHLKDAKVHRDRLDEVGILSTPLEFFSPKLPGLGDVRWDRFVSALTDVGYDGPACIEVEDRAFEPDLDARLASVVQSARYLRQYISG